MRPWRLMAIAVVCLSLWGCGLVNPRPPRAVVADAIAHKVAQTQALLSRQLATASQDSETFRVGSVKVTHHQWTTLADQPVVEVEGTYHLYGGGLTWAQQKQARDFDLYLQRGNTKTEWQVVDSPLIP